MSIDQELLHLKRAINCWEKNVSKLDWINRVKRKKIIALLKLHLFNFEFLVITKRRKARLRWAQKKRRLIDLFLHALQEMQITCIEKLPTIVITYLLNNKDILPRTNGIRPKAALDFYSDVLPLFNKHKWLETFHMSHETFSMVCQRLMQTPYEFSSDDLLTLEKRIALALYVFAKGTDFYSVATTFNVSPSEMRVTLQWFVKGFLDAMGSSLLCMPKNEQEYYEISKAFQQASSMPPLAVGVISIFQLPTTIKCTKTDNNNNAIIQILVDDHLLIRKVDITENKPTLFLRHSRDVNWPLLSGKFIGSFMVAPRYYPLRTWLMKPYDNPQKAHEFHFNDAIEHLYVFPEIVLHRLFSRWNILSTLELIDAQLRSDVVKVSCALHNMLEELEEFYDEKWFGNLDMGKFAFTCKPHVMECYDDCTDALEMRDAIAQCIENDQNSFDEQC